MQTNLRWYLVLTCIFVLGCQPAIGLSATTTPTQTPELQNNNLTAQQVVEAFVSAGLEVGEYRANDPRDWFMGSTDLVNNYVAFFVPSFGVDAGGLVMEFPDTEKRDQMYDAFETGGYYESGIYYPYVERQRNILLQINGILDDDTAYEYIQVLRDLATSD